MAAGEGTVLHQGKRVVIAGAGGGPLRTGVVRVVDEDGKEAARDWAELLRAQRDFLVVVVAIALVGPGPAGRRVVVRVSVGVYDDGREEVEKVEKRRCKRVHWFWVLCVW